MMVLKKAFVGVIVACVLASGSVLAAVKQPVAQASTAPAVQSKSGDMATLFLAKNLAALGKQNNDPLLLLAAAKLQASVAVVHRAREKNTEGKSNNKSEKAKNAEADTVESLLKKVRELAGTNQALLALATEIENTKTRGILGPDPLVCSVEGVLSNSTDIFKSSQSRINNVAEVAIISDAALELSVYDKNNKLLCKESNGGIVKSCAWTPEKDMRYSVKVSNLTGDSSEYQMCER